MLLPPAMMPGNENVVNNNLFSPSSFTTHRVLQDDTACGGCNTGQCIEPAISNLSNNLDTASSTTLGSRPSCDCKGTGYIGEHCNISCSTQCQNGGKCVPADDSETGVECCSCSKAVVDGNPFAGLTCEYGATKSCMTLGSESKHSFCTNGGDCQDIIGDNEQHKDCLCKDGYEGSHCEYLLGTAPAALGVSAAQDGASNNQSQQNAYSDDIVFIMILVVAGLIGVLLLAFGVRAQKRRSETKRREKEIRMATEELSMIPNHNEPGGDSEAEII